MVFPVVGIVGPRQVGKTSLVKNILPRLPKESIYIDLEKTSDYNKLLEPELFLQQHTYECVVIDEIQRKPELFPLLRALIDENRVNGRFIILGSASPELLRQSSESLAGRIAYVEMKPFDILELPTATNQEKNWFRGGFPQALFATDDKFSALWLDNFVKTYTERDLPLLGLSNGPVFLFRLWTMLSHYAGKIINYSDLANSLDVSLPTIKRHIDFYEKAYLIFHIAPFFRNISKRQVKSPKLYFTDTGLLHRLISTDTIDTLFGNPMLGSSWENYCVIQICNAVRNKYDVSYYRTHDGAEMDVVLSKSMDVMFALEIKYTASPSISRSNTMAFKNLQAHNNFVITPNGDDYLLKDNIRTCNINTFIKKYLADDKAVR